MVYLFVGLDSSDSDLGLSGSNTWLLNGNSFTLYLFFIPFSYPLFFFIFSFSSYSWISKRECVALCCCSVQGWDHDAQWKRFSAAESFEAAGGELPAVFISAGSAKDDAFAQAHPGRAFLLLVHKQNQ